MVVLSGKTGGGDILPPIFDIKNFYVNNNFSVKVSKKTFEELKKYFYKTEKRDICDCERNKDYSNFLRKIWERRFSYRKTLVPLRFDELVALIDILKNKGFYRPVPLPGRVNCIYIIAIDNYKWKIFDVAKYLDKYLLFDRDTVIKLPILFRKNFVERYEIECKDFSHIILGVDMEPLKMKYLNFSIGLAFVTLGILAQSIQTVACAKGYFSLILYGSKNECSGEIQFNGHVIHFPLSLWIQKVKHES